jgi:hypothetical protein
MTAIQEVPGLPLEWLHGGALEARDDILGFYRRCEQQGGLVKTHIWRLPIYVVTAPELIEEVLIRKQRCFIKSAGLRSTRFAFGDGLLTSDRQLWLHQRRTVQGAFHARQLERYARLIEEACGRLVATFHDGEVRNIHKDMTDLCFSVLARSLFGEELPEARELVAATAEALHAFHHLHAQWIGAAGGLAFAAVRAVATSVGRPDFVIDPTLLPNPYARRFRHAVEALDEFVAALIKRKRQAEPGDDSVASPASTPPGAPRGPQIRDEIVTMFLAGHETAASSLTGRSTCSPGTRWWRRTSPRSSTRGRNRAAGPGHPRRPPPLPTRVPDQPHHRQRLRHRRPRGEAWSGDHDPQWAVQRSSRYFHAPDAFGRSAGARASSSSCRASPTFLRGQASHLHRSRLRPAGGLDHPGDDHQALRPPGPSSTPSPTSG